jgi:hypothetical protein
VAGGKPETGIFEVGGREKGGEGRMGRGDLRRVVHDVVGEGVGVPGSQVEVVLIAG